MVLNLNAHWIHWISIILLITAPFVMKMNINDVLWHKTIASGATCSRAQCHQTKSFCTTVHVLQEKFNRQKIRASRQSETLLTSFWYQGNNVLQVHNRQTKVILLFKWNYSVKSMQTILYVCSVAVFKLFTRTFITFERNIILAWNFVFLCKNISSTIPEKAKQKFKLLAELLRFRYGIIFYLRTL